MLRGVPLLNAGDSINQGLMGWWPLTEAGGTIAHDISRFNRNATLGGSIVPGNRYLSVPASTRTRYLGSGGYFTAPKFYWPAGVPATVSFWTNTGTNGNDAPFKVGATPTSSPNMFFAHFPYLDNTVYWRYGANELTFSLTSYLNKLIHVALISNGSNFMGAYINGVLVASSASASAPTSGSYGLLIGDGSWTGPLSNLRIFRADKRQQVRRLFYEPWAGTLQSRPVRGAVLTTDYTIAAQGMSRAYSFGAATFARGYAPPLTGMQRRYRFGDATFTFTPAHTTGDTHDGFKRRTRRERALDAAQERAREEWIANRNAVRLSLEAVMGMAVEAADEPAADVLEAVQQAEAVLPALRRASVDVEAMEQAQGLVARLHAAVDAVERERERLRALAEDDEEVLMLLRAL